MRRTALADADLFGHQIKKGDKLILWYISANRDESVFDDGDALKLDRGNARRHLSFGYGVHRCVGARLAELQLRILLEEMAARRMRVTVTGEPERDHARSEEHTSELQSLMRISYAVFCLKKKT